MSKMANNYETMGKGDCKSLATAYEKEQNILNTLFDIKYEKRKTWGEQWYEYARYGYYAHAKDIIIEQKPCFVKNVAMQALCDLERIRNTMVALGD